MAEKKMSFLEIATEFGVCKQTVERTLHALGIRYRKKVTKEYLLENKDIKTNVEMAKELNVDPYTITRAFHKFGIERGKGCSNKLLADRKSNNKIQY